MTDQDEKTKASKLTRRYFIERGSKLGAGAMLAPLVVQLAACSDVAHGKDAMAASDADSGTKKPVDQGGKDSGATSMADAGGNPMPEGTAIADGAVLFGLYAGDGTAALRAAASKLDFSWLKKGDSVLIKVASNSGNPHPATTSVAGVRGMVAELKARGAGQVIVGDQAGAEWVRHSAAGRFSSTRERFMTNNLLEAEQDAEMRFFDDADFNTGYVKATLPDGNRWPRGMYLTSAVNDVDHIVYMPRIGAHVLAGLTLGHKMAIGWLRDDSRHDLHNDAVDFYEKYTEVNYTKEIRDKFRLVVTVAEKILLHGGPDQGTIYDMSPVLVVGSTHLANHDSVTSSVLVTLNASVQPSGAGSMTYNSGFASFANSSFASGAGVGAGAAGPWISGSTPSSYVAHPFEQGISKDRAIVRGWELSGGKPSSIDLVLDGKTIDGALKTGITKHGEGLFKFA